MKQESSEFDSFFDMELSSKQKAALENVLFGNDNAPAPQQQQQPPLQQQQPRQQQQQPRQQQQQQQQQPRQAIHSDEPQIITIDMSRRPSQMEQQGRPQQGRPQQARSPQSRTRTPSNSRPRPNPGGVKKAGARKPGVRKPGARKNHIKTILLILVLSFAAFGIWYYVFVMDTSPPTADPIDRTILIGETIKPIDFVTNIHDDSEIVSIEFVDPPNLESRNDQIVKVIITDEHNNSAIFEAKLTIKLNQSPPVIEGTENILSTLGNPIMYRQGITAYDDFGRELELQVDSSNVNQHAVGEYIIKYWAVDLTGNTTEIEVDVHILDVDVHYVISEADAILGSILGEGKTQLEKVRAIHAWVRTNISYATVMGGPADTVYEDAYRALRDRRGNCYIYYAVSEILLTRAGIENMPIDRIPGTATRHRWSLINPDNLGWHHFDTTPTKLGLGAETAFFTNTQAKDFTRRFVEFNGTQDFYTFNADLYPAIVN